MNPPRVRHPCSRVCISRLTAATLPFRVLFVQHRRVRAIQCTFSTRWALRWTGVTSGTVLARGPCLRYQAVAAQRPEAQEQCEVSERERGVRCQAQINEWGEESRLGPRLERPAGFTPSPLPLEERPVQTTDPDPCLSSPASLTPGPGPVARDCPLLLLRSPSEGRCEVCLCLGNRFGPLRQ